MFKQIRNFVNMIFRKCNVEIYFSWWIYYHVYFILDIVLYVS